MHPHEARYGAPVAGVRNAAPVGPRPDGWRAWRTGRVLVPIGGGQTPVEVIAPPDAGTDVRPFEALMCVEGRWTGDDRLIMVDALSWDGLLPMPLTCDHAGMVTSIVGRIDAIERRPGNTPDERFIVGSGFIDVGMEAGVEIVRQIEAEMLRGVSIELDAVDMGGVDPDTADEEEMFWSMVVESARLRALSVVPVGAFAEAYITLGAVERRTDIPPVEGPTPLPADQVPEMPDDMPDDDMRSRVIVAAGHTITIPDVAPAAWFTEPTDVVIEGALTVTDDGRVYGLLAPANVAHIGRRDGITAPMGDVNYAAFLRGETPTESGRVVTGNITMSCGHGNASASGAQAVEHYDNSCSIVATVAVGERTVAPFGVWVAGALLPGVDADQVRRMMACQLSGHWVPSDDGRGYDLVGALLVPVPGYPMARSRASVTVRDGALVASAVPVQFAGEAPRHSIDVQLGEAAENIIGEVSRQLSAMAKGMIAMDSRMRRMEGVMFDDIAAGFDARVRRD